MRDRSQVLRRYPAAAVSALSGSALLVVVHRHFGATVEGSVGGALVGSFVLLAHLVFDCLFGVVATAAAILGGIVAGGVPVALDRVRRSRRHRD